MDGVTHLSFPPSKKINRGQPIKMSGFTVRTTYLLLELYSFKNTGKIDPFELWNASSRLRENEFSKSVLPGPLKKINRDNFL